MKTKNYIGILAENYVEEQFLMARFQGVYWRHLDGGDGIMFYIPESEKVDIEIALEDWRKRVSK